MAEVIPFKGVLFNVPKISKISGEDLLAPPYDIITPEYRETLYNKSPYNIVKVDFGKDLPEDNDKQNKYTRAKEYLDAWLKEELLLVSDQPGFYLYEISYKIKDKALKLSGFLGLVRLEPLGKGNIYPHEYTHSKPKKDRLELMRHCEANISPIFSLYNSQGKGISAVLSETSKSKPYIEAKDSDGSTHRLWKIQDKDSNRTIMNELDGSAIFIADGHHRYETALEYQKELEKKNSSSGKPGPHDYVLMFLANMADEGISILPTHRLVKNISPDTMDLLSADFEIQEMRNNFDIPSAIAGKRDVYGLYAGGEYWYRLSYKGEGIHGVPSTLKNLDVTILHELIFKQILDIDSVEYEMDVQKCLNLVREKEFAAAFFLNPTRVEDVENVALASLRMPPKSTYFFPKLMTGLVLNIFNKSF